MSKGNTTSQEIQSGGWIKIIRDIREHWIWQDPKKFQWWIDLLCMASYEPKEVIIKNQVIRVDRGQLVWSLRSLAMRWMTTTRTVKRFLRMLEGTRMVVTESVKVSTRITICNYDKYQGEVNANDYTSDYAGDPQRRNKEIKKDINGDFLASGKEKKSLNGFESFIDDFNEIRGSRFTCRVKKTQQQFHARISEGYTSDQMLTALKNFMNDQYHKENGFKHLTPEFITRSTKIERGLNFPDSGNGSKANTGTVDF